MIYSAIWITRAVNTSRRILFANGASVENILITSAALRQHVLLVVYKQRNGIDVLRNKESRTRSIQLGTGKSWQIVNIFNKNWNALSYVFPLDNALINSKDVAMQIRKPGISFQPKYKFLFCVLFLDIN